MRQETITVYRYNELPSEKAKETARRWWSEGGVEDGWWDSIYDDVDTVFKMIGIESNHYRSKADGTRYRGGPDIAFSGFWSQGDGASFAGLYHYEANAEKAVSEYAPKDDELQSIVADLQALQHKHDNALAANLTRKPSRYSHSGTIEFEVWDHTGSLPFNSGSGAPELVAIMMRLMGWIYRRLEAEYEYITSEEFVAETLESNGYEFTVDGKRYVGEAA